MSFTGKQVIGGIGWSYAERMVAQAVSLIVSVVLARILIPEDFGIITIVMIFITICDAMMTGGLGNSLVQKKDVDEKDANTILLCSIGLSLFLYVLIYLTAPLISSFFEIPLLKHVLRVLGIRVVISGINSIQRAWIQRKLQFKKFFFSTLVGVVVSAVIGIAMAKMGFGVWSLVAQYLSNAFLGTVILFIIDDWSPSFNFSWDRARSMFSYGWKVLISTVLYTIIADIKSILIGKKFGPTDLAFFDQGNKFPNILIVNIDATIISVMFPVLSNSQTDLHNLKRMCRRSVKTCMYLVAPLLLGLLFIAQDFIMVIYTEKWMEAVPFLQPMAIFYLIRPVSTMCNQSIMALGRSDISLKISIISSIIIIGLLILAVFIIGDLIWVAYLAVMASLISASLFMVYGKKLFGYKIREQLIDILPNIGLALVMGIIVYSLHFLPINRVLVLVIQVFVGVTIYILLSFLLQIESFLYLIRIFEDKITDKRMKNLLHKLQRSR